MINCVSILVVFLLEKKVDVDDTADEVERSQNNSKDEMSQEVHLIQAPHRCERVVLVLLELTRFAQVLFQKCILCILHSVDKHIRVDTVHSNQKISGVK